MSTEPESIRLSLQITSFYASLVTFLYILLTLRIIRFRFKQRITLGDGQKKSFQYVIRVNSPAPTLFVMNFLGSCKFRGVCSIVSHLTCFVRNPICGIVYLVAWIWRKPVRCKSISRVHNVFPWSSPLSHCWDSMYNNFAQYRSHFADMLLLFTLIFYEAKA